MKSRLDKISTEYLLRQEYAEPDWQKMSEDEINTRYDALVKSIKDKFGLDDQGVKEYSEAMKKYEEIYNTGEAKAAAQFIAKYELSLKKKRDETKKDKK